MKLQEVFQIITTGTLQPLYLTVSVLVFAIKQSLNILHIFLVGFMLRWNLKITDERGQCYDNAAII